jgi:hypothetical protein
MSYSTFDSDLLSYSPATPPVRLRTRDVVVPSDGLCAFRGLMFAVPLGVGMWVGIYYLVRVFI